MKKLFLALMTITALTSFRLSQCYFKDFFPVKHGLSAFKASIAIASIKNLKVDEEKNKYSNIFNRWKKFDYLNGDSVFLSELNYDYIFHDCLKSSDNDLELRFVDDKLYKIIIRSSFPKTRFEESIESYNSLITIFKNNFMDWEPREWFNGETHEQLSEGYVFYPTTKENRNKLKVEELRIDYSLIYERKYNAINGEYYTTGDVSYYVVQIEYVNLKGTKLTSEGYW